MKKSKKILAGIMAVCLMGGIGVIPESIAPVVSITASAKTYGDFNYEVNRDETAVKITKYTGLDAEVIIPSEIDGITVTHIDGDAFADNKKLKSVVIPDSVISIGWGAFTRCSALTDVTLSVNVKEIKPYAFRECTSLTCPMILPETLTTMGSGVFWGDSVLTTVSLPSNIKKIPDDTFYGCSSLENDIIFR